MALRCVQFASAVVAGELWRMAADTQVLPVNDRKEELLWLDGGKKKTGTQIHLGHGGIITWLFARSHSTSTRSERPKYIEHL